MPPFLPWFADSTAKEPAKPPAPLPQPLVPGNGGSLVDKTVTILIKKTAADGGFEEHSTEFTGSEIISLTITLQEYSGTIPFRVWIVELGTENNLWREDYYISSGYSWSGLTIPMHIQINRSSRYKIQVEPRNSTGTDRNYNASLLVKQ